MNRIIGARLPSEGNKTNGTIAFTYNSIVNFLAIDIQGFEITSITGPSYFNITQSITDADKTVRFFLHGIDVDVKLNGSVSYLWQRSITFEHLKIRNITVNMAITPGWKFKGVYSSIQDFDLVVEEPLVARALYNNHQKLLEEINNIISIQAPNLAQEQINLFNQTIHHPDPTPANNPYQIYVGLYNVRWVALSDLFIFDYKG